MSTGNPNFKLLQFNGLVEAGPYINRKFFMHHTPTESIRTNISSVLVFKPVLSGVASITADQ